MDDFTKKLIDQNLLPPPKKKKKLNDESQVDFSKNISDTLSRQGGGSNMTSQPIDTSDDTSGAGYSGLAATPDSQINAITDPAARLVLKIRVESERYIQDMGKDTSTPEEKALTPPSHEQVVNELKDSLGQLALKNNDVNNVSGGQ